MNASIHTKLQLLLIIPLILFCVGADDGSGSCAGLGGSEESEEGGSGSASAKTDCEYVSEALETVLEDYASDIEAGALDCTDIGPETIEEDVIVEIDDILADEATEESAKAASEDSESADDGATIVAACTEFADALATLEEESAPETGDGKDATDDEEDDTDSESTDAEDPEGFIALLEEFGDIYCDKGEGDDEAAEGEGTGEGEGTTGETGEGEGQGEATCTDPDTGNEIECANGGEGENMEGPSAMFGICQSIKDLSAGMQANEDNLAAAKRGCAEGSTELGDDKETLCDSFEAALNGDTTAFTAVEEICSDIVVDNEPPEETSL